RSPGDKSPGYFRMSLRDKNSAINSCPAGTAYNSPAIYQVPQGRLRIARQFIAGYKIHRLFPSPATEQKS
ncbi:MAG: hypothetical protein BWK80_47050, partial [Desulfobacteraceae bacterium IS3]